MALANLRWKIRVFMKRLHDEIRAKLIVELIKIISPETTIGDLELTLTNIERILIEEKILK